ncbi:AAA family ATPase [Staphylothermus hellenicus]|uniref:DNA helicase n=1 Tax=Staphylothermus hellenicus (strain DSM 12710 / JCM 10830 / BK20S6-10-b1 / P8) TaxID=591019 RepID=D7D982_STAHD|nr:MCM family protein [Staphylothermus hellenicus DSM 12710]
MTYTLEKEKTEPDLITRFKRFLWDFRDRRTGMFKYRERISHMASMGQRSLIIDFNDITLFDRGLAHIIENNPDTAIEAASVAIKELVKRENPEYAESVDKFYPRFRNPSKVLKIRELTSEKIGKFVAIEGILTRLTRVEARLVKAVFKHVDPECGEEFEWPEEGEMGERIEKPPYCPRCGKTGKFQLLLNKSKFIDWQKIVVQEKPEEIPPGQIPRSIEVVLTGDLVDSARPGDRVLITGILRVMPTSSARRGIGKSVFGFYLEANYVDVQQKVLEEIEITREDEDKIKELARDPWIREKIIASIAPAIYGHWNIKEAIALLLFGGVPKLLPDGTRIRGDIHILLVGDPGTAKSQMLQYTAKIAPRGIYTSGKGSTAAGLTASVLRDKATGEYYLEAGALVLADGGVACIDEIDKMREEDRSAIHEALEQQSYHKDFKVMLADGRKVKIGDLVDELIAKNKEKIVKGKDTEILFVDDLFLLSYNMRSGEQVLVKADRVSRHKAPNQFIKLRFSNGAEIIVTPEHPVLVIDDGKIKTVRADRIRNGTLTIGVLGHKIIKDINEDNIINSIRGKIVLDKELPYIQARNISEAIEIRDQLMNINISTFIVKHENEIRLYPSGPCSLRRLLLMLRVEEVVFSDELLYEIMNCHLYPATWYELLYSMGLTKIAKELNVYDFEVLAGIIKKVEKEVSMLSQILGLKNESRTELLHLKSRRELLIRLRDKLGILRQKLKDLEEALGRDAVIRMITDVETIKNKDSEWVYDITIEPYHLFVSDGLILHNTVSIAKAGIVARLNARASVLAAGNPKLGRYDHSLPVSKNIDLPPPILSRFDLIFIVEDIPEKTKDTLLAKHILDIHTDYEKAKPLIDTQLLKKYISYARRYIRPKLTQDAKKLLLDFYVNMRLSGLKASKEGPPAIAMTPRQLEALIRLSEAHAKMALKTKATIEDAEEAIRLMYYSLRKVGYDVKSGRLDIDLVELGVSRSKQVKMKGFMKFIDKLFEEYDEIEYKELYKLAKEKGFDKEFVIEMIRRLKKDGLVYEPRPGVLSKVY